MVIDADDTPPDIVALEQLEERWEKARDSVRAGLAILKSEPVPQSFYRPAPTAINTLRSVTRQWMINLVCFS
jgi:anti-sigma factor RsiW